MSSIPTSILRRFTACVSGDILGYMVGLGEGFNGLEGLRLSSGVELIRISRGGFILGEKKPRRSGVMYFIGLFLAWIGCNNDIHSNRPLSRKLHRGKNWILR